MRHRIGPPGPAGGDLPRLGLWLVSPIQIDPEQGPPPGPYDFVLVDVPCTHTGLLNRRPEIRWRLKPSEIRRLATLQTKLLIQGCERLAPGGTVVYSTSSMEPEENQGVIEAVRKVLPQMQFDGEEERVAGLSSDGGYWARLRRKG